MTGSAYVSGLISGIDTASLISQLIALERKPVEMLEEQVSLLEERRSAYQRLNTALLTLKDRADTLARTGTFEAVTATSSDADLLSVTVSDQAELGDYVFTVMSAASRGIVASNALPDPDTPLTTAANRYLDVYLGGSLAVHLDVETTDTLNTLADKINAADAGVRAFVVNDGAGYRLFIQSEDTGTQNQVSVDENVQGLDFQTVSDARDAAISIGETNPVVITSSDNTFENVLPGVTLSVLAQPESPTPVTVQVTRDTESVKNAIKDFVTAYNEVMDVISRYYTYDEETGEAGALFGETQVRLLFDDLASLLTAEVASAPEEVNSLAALGITVDASGRLSVSDEDLDAALSASFEGVKTLFTDATEGIGVRYRDRLDFLTRIGDGVIYTVTDSIDQQISELEERIADMEEALAAREEQLREEFTAMEQALATLQSQSQFLALHMQNVGGLLALLSA